MVQQLRAGSWTNLPHRLGTQLTFWHCRLGSFNKFISRPLLPCLHEASPSIFHHALSLPPPTPSFRHLQAHPCLCNSALRAICYSWSFTGSKPCQKTSATHNLQSHPCFSEATRNDLTTLPPQQKYFPLGTSHSSSWDASPCKNKKNKGLQYSCVYIVTGT